MAIEGILPVIPTPFAEGRFDEPSFRRLLEHMLDHVDGYTLLGSTGEAPSLSTADRIDIAERALRYTPADKTVIVGVTHTSVAESVRLATHAQEHGAAGVLCAMPFYFTNTPDGMLRYLTQLHAVLSVEMVLYDNPTATGTKLDAAQVVAWSRELEHLNTVKLTDNELDKIPIWQQAGLKVMAGDDPIAFRFLAAGVDGAMMIAPALFPAAFRRTWDLVKHDHVSEALKVFTAQVLPVQHVFGIGDEIATSKALLTMMGVFSSDEVLPPLEPTSEARRSLLATALGVRELDHGHDVPAAGGILAE